MPVGLQGWDFAPVEEVNSWHEERSRKAGEKIIKARLGRVASTSPEIWIKTPISPMRAVTYDSFPGLPETESVSEGARKADRRKALSNPCCRLRCGVVRNPS